MIYSDEYTRELNEDGKRILDEFERNTDFWHRDWSLPDDLYPPKHGEKDLERDLIDRCISSAVNNTEIEDPEPPLTLFNLDQGAAKPDEYHEAGMARRYEFFVILRSKLPKIQEKDKDLKKQCRLSSPQKAPLSTSSHRFSP